MIPTRDGYMDALAWMEATITRDHDGKMAIARACDPVELVEGLTMLFRGLIRTTTAGHEVAYLAMLRQSLEANMAILEKLRDEDQ